VVTGATIAEKKPEEQADRTCSFAAKEWQKALDEAQASVVHSSQKSRSRTTFLKRVDQEIHQPCCSLTLKFLGGADNEQQNEAQKLVPEKIGSENDGQ
jgi:hypothetical protein